MDVKKKDINIDFLSKHLKYFSAFYLFSVSLALHTYIHYYIQAL